MEQEILRDIRSNLNEGMQEFNLDVRKFGKLIQFFVKFLFAFLLFALLNALLVVFTKDVHFLSLNTFRLLEEGLRVFINQNLVAFAAVLSENNLTAALMMTFVVVFGVSAIYGVITTSQNEEQQAGCVRDREQNKQDDKIVSCAVSYKQKVCFLS